MAILQQLCCRNEKFAVEMRNLLQSAVEKHNLLQDSYKTTYFAIGLDQYHNLAPLLLQKLVNFI